MFQPRFAKLVESGEKRQTIRKTPKRMPEAGDLIDCRMWSGKPYRSKQHHIRTEEIFAIHNIKISEKDLYLDGVKFHESSRNCVAKRDGFLDFEDMVKWFQKTHELPFNGILIVW